MTSTALAHREQNTLPGPAEWQGMVAIAETLAMSEIVPKAYQTRPHDILAAALLGRTMGLDLMQSMQYVNVIDGKATIAPELMNARIRGAGHRVRVIEWTDTVCTLGFTRAGEQEESTATFTIEDAHRAALTVVGKTAAGKPNPRPSAWETYPKSMLWARTLSMGAKAYTPDAIIGTRYTPDELGAEVDEDGHPLNADSPREALPDHLRVAVEETAMEQATVVEVLDETPPGVQPSDGFDSDDTERQVAAQRAAQPAPAPQPATPAPAAEAPAPATGYAQPGQAATAPAAGGFAQPSPPPPPTPEQEHAKAKADAFRNGWPFGNCKGGDPMNPDGTNGGVDDGSLRWFVDQYTSSDPKYKALDDKRKAWCTAELKRRHSAGAPTADEAKAATRVPTTPAHQQEEAMHADFQRALDADEPWPAGTGDFPPVQQGMLPDDAIPFPEPVDPNTIPLAQLADEQRLNQAAAMELATTMVECGYATDMNHASQLLSTKRDMTAGRARQNIAHMQANRATPA